MGNLIGLVAPQPNYGDRRWWLLCPLGRKDGDPSRRVANLYLPPGGRYFGNREAYGLTYTSCQESGKFSGLYRRLAADMGTDEATIRRALKGRSEQHRRCVVHFRACTSILPRTKGGRPDGARNFQASRIAISGQDSCVVECYRTAPSTLPAHLPDAQRPMTPREIAALKKWFSVSGKFPAVHAPSFWNGRST